MPLFLIHFIILFVLLLSIKPYEGSLFNDIVKTITRLKLNNAVVIVIIIIRHNVELWDKMKIKFISQFTNSSPYRDTLEQ